jgi:4'-phosphopantetheinyl transferase EntD
VPVGVTPRVVLGRASGQLSTSELGDTAARRALRRLGLPAGVTVQRSPGQAPRACFGPVPLPVSLSLSHAGGRAVAAAARGARVGVDILAGPLDDEALWEDHFGAAERAALRHLPDGLRVGFSAKEAAWKALGGTGPSELREYEVTVRAVGSRGGVLGSVHTRVERGPRKDAAATLELRSWLSRGDRLALCSEVMP